ncbi:MULTISPECIES: hypothetical protein [Priestia]|uniref:hypothetical protein n=1 Tax=Priestia TaxID=2800373 RepID=UPI003008383C
MINIKNKKFWFTTVAVLAAPAVLNFTIFQFSTPWTYGDGDEWLSFWGSYSGGLISAYVAYFIANSQIRKQAKIDEIKQKHARYISQLPALVRFQMELQRYIKDIKGVEEERNFYMSPTYYNEKIDKDEDEETKEALIKVGAYCKTYEIKTFNPDLFNIVEKIEDLNLQTQLISCFQFYEDFCSTIVMNIEALEEQKNKVDNEIQFYAEGLDIYYLTTETKRMEIEINRLRSNKISVWETFDDEKMLARFENVLLKVKEEIENVNRAKNAPLQI